MTSLRISHWLVVGFLLATLIYSSSGACRNYGHSCLGAHGKKRADESWRLLSASLTPLTAPRRLSDVDFTAPRAVNPWLKNQWKFPSPNWRMSTDVDDDDDDDYQFNKDVVFD